MASAFGLMALAITCGVAGLLLPELPDVTRFALFGAFLVLGLSPYGIRCPRCRKSILDNGTTGQLTVQKLPDRQCIGCGRDRMWVWPLQDRLQPEDN